MIETATRRFTQDMLKIIALVAMTVDHFFKILCESGLEVGVTIGRVAFPIFAYLIVLHLYEKQIFKKYLLRFSIAGTITLVLLYPFLGFFGNIFYTFLIPVFFIFVVQEANNRLKERFLKWLVYLVTFVLCAWVAALVEYNIFGFIYMISLYGYFRCKKTALLAVVLVFSALLNPLNIVEASISFITTVALLLVGSGLDSHRILNKWFFYIYYPAHLFVLYAIKGFLH